MDEPTKERTSRASSDNDQRVDEMARRVIAESITAAGPDGHGHADAEASVPEAIAVDDHAESERRTPADMGPIPDAASSPDGHHDLTQPQYFLNRELTWLNFNFRVLHEAEDERTPLLERVKFLAIVELQPRRVLHEADRRPEAAGRRRAHDRTVDGRPPTSRSTSALRWCSCSRRRKARCFWMLDHSPDTTSCSEMTTFDASTAESLRARFLSTNIYPLVTPQATDPGSPFPFISNLSLNLLVSRAATRTTRRPAAGAGQGARWARDAAVLLVRETHCFVTLESVMAANLDLLFPGMHVESCELFRVTRNANTELDEERRRRPAGDDRDRAARTRSRRSCGSRSRRHVAAAPRHARGGTRAWTRQPTCSRSTACWACAT